MASAYEGPALGAAAFGDETLGADAGADTGLAAPGEAVGLEGAEILTGGGEVGREPGGEHGGDGAGDSGGEHGGDGAGDSGGA